MGFRSQRHNHHLYFTSWPGLEDHDGKYEQLQYQLDKSTIGDRETLLRCAADRARMMHAWFNVAEIRRRHVEKTSERLREVLAENAILRAVLERHGLSESD